jgi:hypothetical protein
LQPDIQAAAVLPLQMVAAVATKASGHQPYANVKIKVAHIETREPEPSGPTHFATIPVVTLEGVAFTNQKIDVRKTSEKRERIQKIVETHVTYYIPITVPKGLVDIYSAYLPTLRWYWEVLSDPPSYLTWRHRMLLAGNYVTLFLELLEALYGKTALTAADAHEKMMKESDYHSVLAPALKRTFSSIIESELARRRAH